MNSLSGLVVRHDCSKPLPSPAEIASERLAPLVFQLLEGEEGHRETREALRRHVIQAAAEDLAQTSALLELSSVAANQRLLVVKGAANGPMLYRNGTMRPRLDIDVWVDGWAAAQTLTQRLIAIGYREVHQLPGHVARHAIALKRGASEQIDVHARCSRRIRVATAIPFDRAWSTRQMFHLEGRDLWTLSTEDAWLLGALHLSAHHAGQRPPLILIEDLRRLALRLDADQWPAIWDRAARNGLVSALKVGVTALREWSPDAQPEGFVDAVMGAPADESARFLRPVGALIDDLMMLPADDGVEYIKELTYPPSDYLHEHFGVALTRPRAVLAAHRLVSGAVARLSPHGHNR